MTAGAQLTIDDLHARARPRSRPRPAWEHEPPLVVARSGPVPVADALLALARLPELDAPARPALRPGGGAEWIAELWTEGEPAAAGARAQEALGRARAWLAAPAPALPGEPCGADATAIECALAALAGEGDWRCEGPGRYRAHARVGGDHARLHVRALAGGAVHARTDTVLAAGEPRVRLAMALFALETNRRLRLARLSARPDADGALAVVWDAVCPTATSGLPATLHAVAAARAATRHALAALAHPVVAETYLLGRERNASA